MRDIILIAATSMKNNLRLKIIIAVSIAVILLCVVALIVAFCILAVAPAMEAETIDVHALKVYLTVIVYSSCLIGLGVNMNVFAFQTMTREKSRGNMAALLATPLDVRRIWIAKSLAVYLPGLILGEMLALISLIAVNYVYFVPEVGFLFTPWMAVSGFLAAPLIYLGLSLLVHLIGLTGKPATGNVIVQVFLPVFASLMINLGVHNVLDAASWPFAVTNIGVALTIAVIGVMLRSRLTKERIVLSS